MKLKVTVDGKVYEVDVEAAEPEQPHPIYIPAVSQSRAPIAQPSTASAPKATHETVADENKVCRSPIAGVVVRVSATAGQEIKPNDELIVLEAMKMESAITSPVGGTIAKVNVKVGDPVQGGQVLIEFE